MVGIPTCLRAASKNTIDKITESLSGEGMPFSGHPEGDDPIAADLEDRLSSSVETTIHSSVFVTIKDTPMEWSRNYAC